MFRRLLIVTAVFVMAMLHQAQAGMPPPDLENLTAQADGDFMQLVFTLAREPNHRAFRDYRLDLAYGARRLWRESGNPVFNVYGSWVEELPDGAVLHVTLTCLNRGGKPITVLQTTVEVARLDLH